MTDYSDFTTQIAEWANREDWTPALAASFVRMAEEVFNQDLRIDWMIQHDTAQVVDRQVRLPDDWLEADLIRGDDGRPLRYKSRDEFYNLTDFNATGYYTISGRNIVFGGSPDTTTGNTITLDYYGKVPVFSDSVDSWLYDQFNGMYLLAAMMHASVHGVEDERAIGFKATIDEKIGKLNARHLMSKASGSRITRTRTRSFG